MLRQKIMHKLIVSIILLALIVMVVPRGYAQIVEDGLVGYWSFDQIVGKTVKDGLKKHDGAISKGNIKSANNGKIGKALLFDGEPDFVEIDGANDFIANADFTWCAWIKTKEDLGGIVAKTPSEFDTDAQGAKTFFLNAGTLTFDTGWVGVINGLKTVNDDKWHYVAVSAEFKDINATLQFYVDSKKDFQGPMEVRKFPEDDFPILIGFDPRVFAEGEAISAPFNGLIDEVSVYDRVLTEDDIRQNFESDKGLSVEVFGKLAVTWGSLKHK